MLLKPTERTTFVVRTRSLKNAETWWKEVSQNRNHTLVTKQRQANYTVGGRSAMKWNLVVAGGYADNELITKLSKVGAQVRYMEDQLVMNCEQQDAKVRLEGKSARLIQVVSNITFRSEFTQ